MSASVASPWRLLRRTFGFYRRHWAVLVRVVAVVAIPVSVLSIITGGSVDNLVAAYASFATILMNLALIWVIINLEQSEKLTIGQAYYRGTTQITAFILVTLLLVLQMIPLVIALTIFTLGVAGSPAGLVSTPEKLLLGGLAALLSLPTVYWLNRSIFSLIAVQDPQVSPVQAVRSSKSLVKGQSWAVLGRLLFFAVLAVVVAGVPSVAITLSQGINGSARWPLALLQLVLSLVMLPLSFIYLYELYSELT